jgi:biopolymer transport protein ExbD
MKRVLVLVTVLLAAAMVSPASLGSASKSKATKERKQILVYAHRNGNGVAYLFRGQHYSGKDLDYLLGEWHVDAAKDSEVVVVLEDSLALSDVKDVPAMAMKAGFTDVRAFVYWKGTGNMAEVWFGPLVKVTKAVGNE